MKIFPFSFNFQYTTCNQGLNVFKMICIGLGIQLNVVYHWVILF
ncbi:hypothetical protein SAMN05216474_1631 [Lishizhenia tianjinensis]|uniref:Uncharacterized protein n=1 Tax=Lishizhenia tianjinensis TaxID=477690 RepID=A0A1I6ZUI6_9FLAO|nr:hypothetical protein SAMN05216474_1631 [Lishizhenia tianjinensis]